MAAPALAVPADPPEKHVRLAGAVLAGAALLAYGNSFTAPFIFDDKIAITANESIRHLATAFAPPLTGGGAAGRPLVNFSFAVNYALSGLNPWSYHVVNLLLHTVAGLILFGLVRRTLALPVLRARFGAAALPLGFFTALLWTLHPLLTESVTCVVQRNEILAGICYLLVPYGLARAAESPAPRRWLALSFSACLAGVFCKELMASAPLLALAYQAILVDGSWRTAWQRRGKFCALLALTWVPLAGLILGHHQRDGTVGFGLGIAWWEYALTQCRAILLYLKLSFWPHPLVLDYGNGVVKNLAAVWWQALALAALLAGTVVAWRRRLTALFPALWFWAILAPSSSILPLVTQTIAEHRMYLPLAAVVVLAVTGLYTLAGRRSLAVFAGLAVALGAGTFLRNRDYRDAFTIYSDNVAHAPENNRAHTNLGSTLADLNQPAAAIAQYELALRIKPDFAGAHFNLGSLLDRLGRKTEAIPHYLEAIRLQPTLAQAHYNLGAIFAREARWAEAEEHFAAAVRLDPAARDARVNLANVLVALGRHADAVPQFEAAIAAGPQMAELHLSLATALSFAGRTADAIAQFELGLGLEPDHAEAQFRLGVLLARAGRRDDAMAHYRTALRLKPDYPEAHFALGVALLQAGQRAEGAGELEAVLRLRPDFPGVRELLQKLAPPRP